MSDPRHRRRHYSPPPMVSNGEFFDFAEETKAQAEVVRKLRRKILIFLAIVALLALAAFGVVVWGIVEVVQWVTSK